MNYKEFYKSELFPEKDILITDEYLIEHGWHKYGDMCEPNTKWYYFDNGILGRINVDACSETHHYSLHINYRDHDSRSVKTISDVKAAIYSFICGQRGYKYGFDKVTGGYKYLSLDTEEEEDEYRYNQYIKMTKWMNDD